MGRNKAPLYDPGEAYYLSHKNGIPAKIYVEAVYKKAHSKEWMYSIFSEANNCKQAYLSESALKERIAKPHNAPVYKIPEIAKRWEDGYRFCGNYPTEDAIKAGHGFAKNGDIESVVLYPAMDADGNLINNQHGVWIRWKHVIENESGDSTIVIK